MKRNEILSTLASFKKGREALVADFCNEEPRLYRPMFAHKPLSSDMNIAISRYMFGWLGHHPFFYKELLNTSSGKSPIAAASQIDGFIEAYRNLCEKFVVGDLCGSGDKSHVLEKVVKDSIEYLDGLLSVSKRSDERLEMLCYQGEKSKHLFDRAFNGLREGNNGVL
jgi:hypothetical protein